MFRIGVDVGGTFTDVVAIDAATRKLFASVKVPTTHDAPEGVAAGIVEGIKRLLTDHSIAPQDVAFIAHSTTQATNSLLEGDVARVGVIGLIEKFGWLAKNQIRFKPFELAPKVAFAPAFAFARASARRTIEEQIDALARDGAEVVAASQAFSVDRSEPEDYAVAYAKSRGLLATAGHDVSSMYGLRARTRTVAINAAILPKMVRTATMTRDAVRNAKIASPLMIMRSDGGVMDVQEIERRPILTLLSGPAAGIAGALLHENVTDGIFIEVGGTSADCSAIRAGLPQMRPARIGGRRMMLRTVDVRTLGIAGGSMVRLSGQDVLDVGPRSAHIAGLDYAAFTPLARISSARVERIKPTPHDPDDYVALVAADGTRIAITPTCAANALGYVPESAFAFGNAKAATAAFELIGRDIGMDGETLARRVLDIATDKVIAAVNELIADYELDPELLVIVGGGGGAAALVPYAAQRSKHEFRLARDAEVISPIGVALALVRDVVERTVVDPSPADIISLRREAGDKVIAAGAAPESVEVAIEIDTQRNLVRATASGASALSEDAVQAPRSSEEQGAIAATLLRCAVSAMQAVQATPVLTIFKCGGDLRVLDQTGVARLSLRDALITQTDATAAPIVLAATLEEQTSFGDVGRALPNIFLVHGARIADLSGLATAAQVVALATEELGGLDPSAPVAILTARNKA
ncbi:MAG: hydantoinase/oxoprolinase family protein [Candidatus Baltobacteraceae bacterium]